MGGVESSCDDSDSESEPIGGKGEEKRRFSQAEVILRWQAGPYDIIKHCSFVDDERPNYIFIMLESTITSF